MTRVLSILVVDDQAINRKLLRVQLEGEGHQVVEAAQGVEALEVLAGNPVDAIISDILMPVMDGYRFCEQVRASEAFRGIAFIFYTATYTSPGDEQLCIDLGADGYVRKPSNVAVLLRAVDRALLHPGRRPSLGVVGKDIQKEYSDRLAFKLEEKNEELSAALNQLSLQATALDTAAEAVLITNVDGTIQWVNRAFVATTGFTQDEAIGNNPSMFKSGLHDAHFYQEFWDTIRRGETWRGEITNRRSDGSLLESELTVSPVLGTDGSITHFVSVMHDIALRKHADREIRATHAYLRQILDYSPAVTHAFVVSSDGEIVPSVVSEDVHRLLGFTVAETMKEGWWEGALHPDDRAAAGDAMAEVLSRGVSHSEYRMAHKDGGYRWVDSSLRLIRDAFGRAADVIGVWIDITERKRAQEELRESERRFSEMLQNLELLAIMLDTEWRITYCNDSFLRFTGWELEEVLGRDWMELFIPAELQSALSTTFSDLRNDRPSGAHHDNEIVTRSGVRKVIQWNNSLLRSGSGEVLGAASIGEDITDRRLAEQAARERTERYQRQHAALAYLTRRPVLQTLDLDRALRAITSTVAHAAQVERVSIWRYTNDRRSIVAQDLFAKSDETHTSGAELTEERYPVYFESLATSEVICANDALDDPRTNEFVKDDLRPVGISSTLDAPLLLGGVVEGVVRLEHVGPPRFWHDDEQSFVVAIANLVSLALAQRDLAASEMKLRLQASLLDKARDAILMRDLNHVVLFWNKSAERLYGWTEAEAIGRSFLELLSPRRERFEEAFRAVSEQGDWTGEVEVTTKEGTILTIESRWTLVRDDGGDPTSVLSIDTDVTERRALERQFIRAQRMESLGTLAGGIAHDLNNVLMPILMGATLLKRLPSDPRIAATAETIERSARRGADLVKQVLSFARGVAGIREAVDLRTIVGEVESIVRSTFPKNIRMDVHLNSDLGMVTGDATQLNQVLLNLVVNARDAMPRGGLIVIAAANTFIGEGSAVPAAAAPGRYVLLEVADDGMGMSKEVVDRIFEPFFTTKELSRGTGLGLSTVQGIVRSHGGFVDVVTDLGKGSTFRVFLPEDPQRAVATLLTDESEDVPMGKGQMIIVVDDEVAILGVTRDALESFGYRVITAEDGLEAVRLITRRRGEVALVITDLMMPVMDGAALVASLRRIDPDLPVIVTSGNSSDSMTGSVLRAGARRFLAKPYSAHEILRAVAEVLGA